MRQAGAWQIQRIPMTFLKHWGKTHISVLVGNLWGGTRKQTDSDTLQTKFGQPLVFGNLALIIFFINSGKWRCFIPLCIIRESATITIKYNNPPQIQAENKMFYLGEIIFFINSGKWRCFIPLCIKVDDSTMCRCKVFDWLFIRICSTASVCFRIPTLFPNFGSTQQHSKTMMARR